MKTLNNHTLIYDKDCPLCQVYTSGFIKSKMLDTNGRKAFSTINTNDLEHIDINRASNEIALIDTKNKTVYYGINSLLKVIGHSFPIIEKIGNLKPINFLLKKLYSFISYNRKVIIPSKNITEGKLQCTPTYSFKYRLLYLLFTVIVTTLVLFKFSKLIPNFPNSTIEREFVLAFAQIIFQGLFILKLEKKVILNYLGNLMTVSLMGSLILIPLLLINSVTKVPELTNLLCFGLTVGFMFLEHVRRIKLLKLPSYLSYSWVIYRIIALLIILKIN